ncbi:MAG: YbbR-like domain-containing protein [Ruminococcus sp.]
MKENKSKAKGFKAYIQSTNFLFILSVVISLSIWIIMSISTGNDTSLTISGIPVQVELSDEAVNNGLQVFSGSDYTASLTVTGNRAVVGSLQASDITVKAAANYVDSAGNYTLYLNASKNNPYSDFQISSSIKPSTIDVYIDYLREATFDIQENVVYKVDDGYYASTTLSSKTVYISGPQSEVSKIAKVVASADIDGTLNSSQKVDADIKLYNSEGQEIKTDLLSLDFKTVEAAISVLPEKEVPLKPVFTNLPSGLQITDDMISVEPSSIMLAGTDDVLVKTDSVSLAPIDFTTLTNTKTTFDLAVEIPTDCKNISNTSTAKVTLDLSSLSSKKLVVEKFTVQGLASGYSAEVTQKSLEVTVYGTSSQIDSLNASDITAVIDVSASDGMKGSVSMPVTFAIENGSSCWVSGSYKANLTISES